jgi:hypothetical protein
MTDYALTVEKIADSKRGLSIGQRLLLWIEMHQQHKADREIARFLHRV